MLACLLFEINDQDHASIHENISINRIMSHTSVHVHTWFVFYSIISSTFSISMKWRRIVSSGSSAVSWKMKKILSVWAVQWTLYSIASTEPCGRFGVFSVFDAVFEDESLKICWNCAWWLSLCEKCPVLNRTSREKVLTHMHESTPIPTRLFFILSPVHVHNSLLAQMPLFIQVWIAMQVVWFRTKNKSCGWLGLIAKVACQKLLDY